MLANGPERRMAQDARLGRPPQRGDLEQARSYRAQLTALDAGRVEVSTNAQERAPDALGLDRSRLD
jgi:hypothetical protein